MAIMWRIQSAKMVLIAMASYLLIRGRQARIENRGKAIDTPIPLGEVTDRDEDAKAVLGTGLTYTLVHL